MKASDQTRADIAQLVERYAEEVDLERGDLFAPDTHSVPPSGKVIGAPEMALMVDAALDGWLTAGRFNDAFERELSKFLGMAHVLTTTSGSSANLLALTALTSPRLKERALKKGDEVITVAAGFPTTVNPIIQNGLVPVFVDVELETYNIDVTLIEAAISHKTRAIMIAHTLGNPFNLDVIMSIAKRYNFWVVEDCCDALGSTYDGRMVGTFGDIATYSFYPAHHITMGEGGAVVTRSGKLRAIIESFRDWGRDCFCPPGQDNTCNKRFCRKLGNLPYGYDHKYTYSHVGYNLKITDLQAACGLAQLGRLEGFISSRKENFTYLSGLLTEFSEHFIFPKATSNSAPSWFGFPITIRPESDIQRVELLQYLDQRKVGTRLLFAGNLTKQPYFDGLNYRIATSLKNTDVVMNNTFWLGVYPGLGKDHLLHIRNSIADFLSLR